MQKNNKDFMKRKSHQDNDISSDMKQLADSFLHKIKTLGKEEEEPARQKRGMRDPNSPIGINKLSGEGGGLDSLQQKWNRGEQIRRQREAEEERRHREDEEERKRQLEAKKRRLEKEEKERKEATELINQLKSECWSRHISYMNTEKQYREYREMFSKNGGILHYVQRFAGLAEYELESFSELEQLKLKCRDQIISGLSACIRHQLDQERYGTGGKASVEFREEAFYESLGIDFNNQATLEACDRIIEALRRKLKFQEENINQLYQEYNNYFYKDLWDGVKAKLEELQNQESEAWEALDQLKAWIKNKATELMEQFKKYGVEFIFFNDCTEQEARDQYFMILDSCDQVPAVIRKKDNFIYFKGRYEETTKDTIIN